MFGYPRDYLKNHFVYLTISPRARGLSIGVNLNPDKGCNFDCVYCEVDRRVPADKRALDLNVLVADVLGLYENSRVPIIKRLAEGLPRVWADGAQIRQVIHNLIQNAQDALENTRIQATTPTIEVRTELAGDRVRLAVSDNGGGFPEELMARIFEPYVTTKPRGTGLGLAIVKKIVDEHHGSIAIENRPSRGASVSVLLPLSQAA